MLGGKRCYLCGEKLVNGRCVECGLDNEKNTKKVYHLNESVKMQDSQPRDAVQKIGKGLAIGSVILLVAAVGAVALNSYFEEQEKGQSQSGEEYDEYQFAKRQLSETGEAYDEVLTGGYYEVGVHIPEGIYTVEAQDGESAIYLIDDENGIYIWQQIGNDPENPNQAAAFIRWSSFGSEKRGSTSIPFGLCADRKASWRDKSTAGFSASRSRTDNDCGA